MKINIFTNKLAEMYLKKITLKINKTFPKPSHWKSE